MEMLTAYQPSRSLRSSDGALLTVPKPRLKSEGDRRAPRLWTDLNEEMRFADSLSRFISLLNTYSMWCAFYIFFKFPFIYLLLLLPLLLLLLKACFCASHFGFFVLTYFLVLLMFGQTLWLSAVLLRILLLLCLSTQFLNFLFNSAIYMNLLLYSCKLDAASLYSDEGNVFLCGRWEREIFLQKRLRNKCSPFGPSLRLCVRIDGPQSYC